MSKDDHNDLKSISHWGIPHAYKKALDLPLEHPFNYKFDEGLTYKPAQLSNTPSSVECPIARKVAERVAKRAAEGMKKYGVTMERKDVGTVGWIDHTIEELLDAAVYLTKLKEDIEQITRGK